MRSTTALLGWIIITVAFASSGGVMLYPGYRLARSAYPDSRTIRWIYAGAVAVFGVGLWFLLPLLVHRFLGLSG